MKDFINIKKGGIIPSFINKNKESIIFIFFFCIVALLLIQTFNRALRVPYGNDFTLFLQASEIFFEYKNPYENFSTFIYIYPQLLCVLIYPLTLLNYNISIIIWFLLSNIFLLLSYLEFLKLCKITVSSKKKLFYFSLLYLSLFSIIQDNLLNGQVNFFILFLIILFFKYLKQKPLLSAIFLSLSISIKLTPLIFTVFLFGNKNIKSLILTYIFSLIFIFIIPLLFIPFDTMMDNYIYYMNKFILYRTQNFDPNNLHAGFSLTMFISQLFGKFSFIISSLLCISYLIYMQYIKDDNNLIISGYCLSIILISPMSEQHHLILIYPLLIYLFLSKNIINICIALFFIITSSIKIISPYLLFSLIILYISVIINSKSFKNFILKK